MTRAVPDPRESVEAPGGSRITTLADGVFAIVMTLLVLGIDPPRVAHEELDDTLAWTILQLWPRIAAYVVSFLVLGIYWMGHHAQFHFVGSVNRVLLWLNILFLMAISLVPFTTDLVGHYGDQRIAIWLYSANFILVSLLLLAHWRYAASRGLLRDEVDDDFVAAATRQILFGPAIYVVAIGVAWFEPLLSMLVLLVVPVLHLLPGPVHLHWTR